jgi:hypothetical protein
LKNLQLYLDFFVKKAQTISLDDQSNPNDIENYRSSINNILFISQDDANINNWDPQLNQNIGKPSSTAPTKFKTKL